MDSPAAAPDPTTSPAAPPRVRVAVDRPSRAPLSRLALHAILPALSHAQSTDSCVCAPAGRIAVRVAGLRGGIAGVAARAAEADRPPGGAGRPLVSPILSSPTAPRPTPVT